MKKVIIEYREDGTVHTALEVDGEVTRTADFAESPKRLKMLLYVMEKSTYYDGSLQRDEQETGEAVNTESHDDVTDRSQAESSGNAA